MYQTSGIKLEKLVLHEIKSEIMKLKKKIKNSNLEFGIS